MTKKEKITAVLCVPLGIVWLAMYAPDTPDVPDDKPDDPAATNPEECLDRATRFAAGRWPLAEGGTARCSNLWPSNDLGQETKIESDMACSCWFRPEPDGERHLYWISAGGPLIGEARQ